MMFFDSEKNTIKQQIQAEFQKNASQKPPKPTRGVKPNTEEDDFDEKKYVIEYYFNITRMYSIELLTTTLLERFRFLKVDFYVALLNINYSHKACGGYFAHP